MLQNAADHSRATPTRLFDPSARLTLLKFLSERLLRGQAKELAPPVEDNELLAKLASMLASLGVYGAADIVQGQVSEQQQLEFFDMMTSLVEEMQSISDTQQSQKEMPEARLLAAACSQLDPMLSTDLKLLELSPTLQKLYSQPQRPDAVAELQGQFQKLQQASNQPAGAGRGQQTHCSEAGASQLEECLDAFLTAAEDFNHLFHTELEPWTCTVAPAVLHGIGSMAVEVDTKYSQLQDLLTALTNTRTGHNKLTIFKKQNALGTHSGNLQSLLDDVATKHKSLQLQQQMLMTIQQRLALSQAREPQVADL
ncbi:hypothetical protein WJX77_001263 [Trebouxia sp. C0004]